MAVPDVLGYPLARAQARLAEAGCPVVRVVRTQPPGATEAPPDVRVVRQRVVAEGVELVVAGWPPVRRQARNEVECRSGDPLGATRPTSRHPARDFAGATPLTPNPPGG